MERELIEKKLFEITHDLLAEMQAERALRAINKNAELEADLGLGSLERAEFFHRIEKAFNVKFDIKAMSRVVSLTDMIGLVQQAKPTVRFKPRDIKPIGEHQQADVGQAKTLLDVLNQYQQQLPTQMHICIQDEAGNEEKLTYGDLYAGALSVAKGLQQYHIKPGETISIMLPTCKEFFFAFMGITLAGCVPVPIYPPFRPDQIEEYTKREVGILSNAEVRILITFQPAENLGRILKTFIQSLIAVKTVDELIKLGKTNDFKQVTIEEMHPALIQYTSGSTGAPKGVLLSHENLLSNIRAYGKGLGIKTTDVTVSWLPLYHDMGLIGTWLGSFYYGSPLIIMSPLTFLSRPERWLWAIHYHRATISAGPNFAYELCVHKIHDEDIEGLDLSSWRLAFNGAEAIYPKTIRDFFKRFNRYGLKETTMFPVYGLAESAVALTFPPVGRVPVIDRIEREAFEKKQQAIKAAQDEKNCLEFVCCGSVLSGHEIRIVDKKNRLLADRHVGHLQFRGPSAMQGYYHNEVATNAVNHDGWLDTGDLAYMVDDEIYITGRYKDTIIKAGRNLYPPEIEETVSQVVGVRAGCAVAFGVYDQNRGTEKFIIVAEMRDKTLQNKNEISQAIIEDVTKINGIAPDEVILVRPKSIPKTSSGKLRRSSCKELYLLGKLGKSRTPKTLQFIKLTAVSIVKKIKSSIHLFLKSIYNLYAYGIMYVGIFFAWSIALLNRPKLLAMSIKILCRVCLTLIGCPIKVVGKELLQARQAIYVANHTSYVDVFSLVAVLPSQILFIAKHEVAEVKLIGTIIKRLNYVLIDRDDFLKSVSTVAGVSEKIDQGFSLVVFPEGTFTYATGLRGFKLGAFKIAAENNLPIVPIALKGTRKILRSGSNLIRPGRIHMTILPELMTSGIDIQSLTKSSREARKQIAKYCGEPPIDLVAAGHKNV